MRFGGIVLVVLLCVGACSSDPSPREPEPSRSAAPTAAAPTMPPQAAEDSPEGAAAFVTHYVDVFNYAASTGDVEELSRLSSPECEGCQSYIKLYKDTYAAGGYFKGGDWAIDQLEIEESTLDRRVFARFEAPEGTQAATTNGESGPTSRDAGDLIFLVTNDSGAVKLARFSRSAE